MLTSLTLVLFMMQAPNYSVSKTVTEGVEVVRLADASHQTEVSLAPSLGNLIFQMKVAGKDIVYAPPTVLTRPGLSGIPFIGPWINRLEGSYFYANGKKYSFNPDLGNVRLDGNKKPLHGLLSGSKYWTLIDSGADARSAWATSKLEFWKHPELMAQFPFAHTVTLTYRLANGELQVETTIDNLSADPMPVGIGFHPYFRVDDAPRDAWKIHIPAKDHIETDAALIPTGEFKPITQTDPQPLQGVQFDDGFAHLVRDADGRARFWVEGVKQRVTVSFGPKFPVGVIYAPSRGQYVCFEPMAGMTNAFNLAQAGKYPELQSVPPGGQWKESFWVSASGF